MLTFGPLGMTLDGVPSFLGGRFFSRRFFLFPCNADSLEVGCRSSLSKSRAQCSTLDRYSNARSSTLDRYSNARSSTLDRYHNARSSTSDRYSNARSSTLDRYPNARSSTSDRYSNARSSTSDRYSISVVSRARFLFIIQWGRGTY